ncbi:TEL2-interacting protein 1 [Erysiphe neolycopersici]|uniref:TEL2-interacting protein 1 n=1 Tax=Erysiphe neolycopersici TaxID=212602 RepID=A0A420HE91_9PEZI|nr:TEL2-interacting protein 1 [Erysiphe neolycopersici]
MDNETKISARDKLFRQLKPHCVKLNQLALFSVGSSPNDYEAFINTIEELLVVVEKNCQQTVNGFDHKLADYVFYPISQILRRKEKITDRLLELTIKCVKIILQHGWRESITLELAKQLLILLTFMAGGKPSRESILAPEEVLLEALGALAALFNAIKNTEKGPATLKEAEVVLALGSCVSVILDAIVEGPSGQIQLGALSALDAAWHCIQDQELLSKFLPGVVSTLTKCLMPSTKIRRQRRVLVRALEVLCYVLTSILNDIITRKVNSSQKCLQVSSKGDSHVEVLTAEWLKVTSEQIRLALLNIVKLRSHEAVEVRNALNNLCITLLDECHYTLSNSSQVLVETCMSLHKIDSSKKLHERNTNLTDLAFIHTDLIDLIKEIAHNWVISLPKVMQTNDDTTKIALIRNLSMTQELLSELHLKSTVLDEAFIKSLRDCITVIIDPLNPSSKPVQETNDDLSSQVISTFTAPNSKSMTFQPIIMPHENQKKIRENFMTFIHSLSVRDSYVQLADEMLEYARYASGSSVLSSYWLAFQILKLMVKNKEVDDLLNTSSFISSAHSYESLEQELYVFSLSLICKNNHNVDYEMMDWRLQAIALEMVADFAHRMGHGFRTELVDTLYPVVQFLGSPISKLREHAITCLNIFSHSCGYNDSSTLIIQNVDYMVNAISLQLNTFNIVPQGPQVLIMMIRLAGPSLLPYLDDIVESIFAALANYHGYPKLVGILFSVLAEIVVSVSSIPLYEHEKGIKHREISHRKRQELLPPLTINQIIDSFLSTTTLLDSLDPEEILSPEPFPHTPWKSQESSSAFDNEMESELDHTPEKNQIEKLAASSENKTYKMLHSIAQLCQYYLTSSSPILRARLLGLLDKSVAALCSEEDQFLPLVNDIWPVVIKRVYDPESFVCIAACDFIATLCRCSGDFLATRISVEWSNILKLANATTSNVSIEKKRYGTSGKFTQSSQVWEALQRMFVAIINFVGIQDTMFDDLLVLFGSIGWENEDINNAMENVNMDAMWLASLTRGCIKAPATPVLDDYKFIKYNIYLT